jgi:hypothetical protein
MTSVSLSAPSDRLKKYVLWLTIGLSLALGLVYVLIPSLEGDAVDIDKIGRRFCNNESLDPDDLALLKDHLFNTEQIDFQDITEMQDYLCGNCRDCFFPKGDKEIKNFFGVSVEYFHSQMKKNILKTLPKTERIKRFLKKVNNPDLGLNNKTGRLVLKNTQNAKETLETNVLFKDILP